MLPSLHVYISKRRVHRQYAVLSQYNIRYILFRELVAKHHPYDIADLSNIRESHNVRIVRETYSDDTSPDQG